MAEFERLAPNTFTADAAPAAPRLRGAGTHEQRRGLPLLRGARVARPLRVRGGSAARRGRGGGGLGVAEHASEPCTPRFALQVWPGSGPSSCRRFRDEVCSSLPQRRQPERAAVARWPRRADVPVGEELRQLRRPRALSLVHSARAIAIAAARCNAAMAAADEGVPPALVGRRRVDLRSDVRRCERSRSAIPQDLPKDRFVTALVGSLAASTSRCAA